MNDLASPDFHPQWKISMNMILSMFDNMTYCKSNFPFLFYCFMFIIHPPNTLWSQDWVLLWIDKEVFYKWFRNVSVQVVLEKSVLCQNIRIFIGTFFLSRITCVHLSEDRSKFCRVFSNNFFSLTSTWQSIMPYLEVMLIGKIEVRCIQISFEWLFFTDNIL